MSEKEEASHLPVTSEQVALPEEKSGGNKLAVAALLLALLAVAAALFLGWELHQTRLSAADSEQQLRATLADHDTRAQAQHQDHQLLASRLQALEVGGEALREALAQERIEWLVAESDYLLRIAGRRQVLEHDVAGALTALRTADGLLASANHPLYLPVREKLQEEIRGLEQVQLPDLDGIALQLATLSHQLDTLPLTTARRDITAYQQSKEETVDSEGSWFKRLLAGMWRDVKSLVVVRRLDQKIEPLLPPEQRFFLIEDLRLRLESARLALLRGDNRLYAESLRLSSEWLNAHFDREDGAVRSAAETLQRLAAVDVAPALPAPGAALAELDTVRAKSNRGKRP